MRSSYVGYTSFFLSGVFEIVIYTSVQLEKRMQAFTSNERDELSDADLATLLDWTTDIVRIPDT